MMKHSLIIVCGLQGTGKTTVAKLIESLFGAVLLRSDVIRKEMCTHPIYSEEEMQAVYDEMLSRAEYSLQNGNDVVLDATFSSRSNRFKAIEIAKSVWARIEIIEVRTTEIEVRKRLEYRQKDESDANWEVYKTGRESYEQINQPHTIIRNAGSIKDLEDQVKKLFGDC